MARTCTICSHSEREQIDREIIAGLPYRDISGRFALSKSAVERHAGDHIPQLISRARELRDWLNADQLVGELCVLQRSRTCTPGPFDPSRPEPVASQWERAPVFCLAGIAGLGGR